MSSPSLTLAELAAWLRLKETWALGTHGARRLLAAFGSPEAVLAASETALAGIVGAPGARALLDDDPRRDALPDATWRWLAQARPNVPRDVVVLGDPRYPARLLEIADPPLLLHVMGDAALLQADSLAIVGSRSATPQGLVNAHTIARALSERGWTIVSGLAQGVDGAAHAGGLDGRGRTIAFVGTGLDQVYPTQHAELALRIAEGGLVVSEHPPGTGPLAMHFPRRNRLIAGLTQGTLVVEAALKSGSLITARLALDAGREVFAIPGSIHAPTTRGCHALLRQGAKLVETADDIVQELRPAAAAPRRARMTRAQPSLFAAWPPGEIAPDEVPAPDDGAPDDPLLQALGHDPVTFDALVARTGLASDRLAAQLLDLELSGRVQRLPGGLFQRRATA